MTIETSFYSQVFRFGVTVLSCVSVSAFAAAPDPKVVNKAEALIREQAMALGLEDPQSLHIAPSSNAGLLETDQAGEVPIAIVTYANSIGDVRGMLAIRALYRARNNPKDSGGILAGAFGYAGLIASEHVRNRDAANPSRNGAYYPTTGLDNIPIGGSNGDAFSARLVQAARSGTCEADTVAMLRRLAKGAPGSGAISQLVLDARRVLRDLGIFALHPSDHCFRESSATFDELKSLAPVKPID